MLRARGNEVVRISIDGFHNPRQIRYARAEAEPAASYYEDSFDYDSFLNLAIKPIEGEGERLITPRIFDHASDSPAEREEVRIGDEAIVLVDGIFLGRPQLAAWWDCWIYLAVDRDVARSRGAARDERLYGAATINRYRTRYEPGQELYHAEADPVTNADIVIDNTTPDRPAILRG